MVASSKVTFQVDAELRRTMDEHPEVNWSAVLRDAIRRHADSIVAAERMLAEAADPRVRAVADRLKLGAGERYRRALRGGDEAG